MHHISQAPELGEYRIDVPNPTFPGTQAKKMSYLAGRMVGKIQMFSAFDGVSVTGIGFSKVGGFYTFVEDMDYYR